MSAATPDMIQLGVHLAWRLGIPLRIGGADVPVPSEIGQACAPAEPDEMAGADDFLATVRWPDVEIARRSCYMAALAAREIEASGLDLGLLLLEPAVAAGLDRYDTPAQPEPEPEPAPPVITERLGEVFVGDPPLMAVRSSDGGKSWHCVQLSTNHLANWHPSKSAAVAWAIKQVQLYAPRDAADKAPHFTWPADEPRRVR